VPLLDDKVNIFHVSWIYVLIIQDDKGALIGEAAATDTDALGAGVVPLCHDSFMSLVFLFYFVLCCACLSYA